MDYKITEQSIKSILAFAEELPTKWGRQLQDYLRENVTLIEEEITETEEVKESNQ